MSTTSRGVTIPDEEVESTTAKGPWGGKSEVTGKYADVNGIKLYYEIHGTGHPLVLLHGGLGDFDVRAKPSGAREGPSGHRRGPAGTRPNGRHRSTDQPRADGRGHRGGHQAAGARQARSDGVLAGRRRRDLRSPSAPGARRQARPRVDAD